MTKKFVLGVGAQKAGTTWLHYYMTQQPFSDFGFRKEYHVFDAAESTKSGFYMRARKAALTALTNEAPTAKLASAIQRMDFILNPDSYYDYFASRFLNPDVCLTGDITPSYALLKPEVFANIDREFKRRGVTVFPVFLMRDPVYRLQSMVRMSLRDGPAKPTKAEEIAQMERFLTRHDALSRGGYPGTLENLYEVFGRERVYLNLYETMFTDALQTDLSEHLGLDLSAPPLGETKNVSKTDNSLNEDEYNSFRTHMISVYDGVLELTGLDIGSHWRFRDRTE